MQLYDKAEAVARMLLRGQVDKAGLPMFEHAKRVAGRMKTYGEAMVAMLHDVVEDTQATLDDLDALGFAEWRSTLDALTRRDGEPYQDYLVRLSRDPLAVKIKLADIADHLRPVPGFELPRSMLERYLRAEKLLRERQ